MKKKKDCIICGQKNVVFLPGGFYSELFEKHKMSCGGKRDNCVCPNCYSSDRERWLYYLLMNYTNIETLEGKILHFAPEKTAEEYIRKNPKIDYYSGDVECGRAMHVIDITNIQFSNELFDYVICNHVLEHIPNVKKAVKELKRVLKRNGELIFSFPICLDQKTFEDKNIKSKEDRVKYYGQEDHVRLYGTDYKKIFNGYGLDVQIFSPKDLLEKKEIERCGYLENDVIMFARKKPNIMKRIIRKVWNILKKN